MVRASSVCRLFYEWCLSCACRAGRVFLPYVIELRGFPSPTMIAQVGTGIIALEFRRSDNKDREKRAKEAEYRERVDREIREERQVRSVPLGL